MQNPYKSESGRSMLEMIAIIVLIALLLIVGLWGFKTAVLSSRVNTMTKDMSNAITERRYQIAQGGTSKPHTLNSKVGITQMTVENITSGPDRGEFTVLLSQQSKDICEEIKKYNIFTPEKIEINGSVNNDCIAINSLKFYFDPRKNGNGGDNPLGGLKCPAGNVTSCSSGEYKFLYKTLSDGKECYKCEACLTTSCPSNSCCSVGTDAKTGCEIQVPRACNCTTDAPEGYVSSCTGSTYAIDTKILANGTTKCYKCEDCPPNDPTPSDTSCWTQQDKTDTPTGCSVAKTWVKKASGTSCGECKQCNADGECINYKQSLSPKKLIGNCCKDEYCSLTETPGTECTDDIKVLQSTDTSNVCKTVKTYKNTCTNAIVTEETNNSGSCGECGTGTCTNGTCNDPGKTTETFYHLVNGECTNSAISYCPGNKPAECIPPRNCLIGTSIYTDGSSVEDCGLCQNGEIKQDTTKTVDVCHTCNATTSWGSTLKEAGKETVCGTNCCRTGSVCISGSCSTNIPEDCNDCQKFNRSTGICDSDIEQNGQHIQVDGKCCINGSFSYDSTYCPLNCTTCGMGNELSGLTFDSTTMVAQNTCQCICNEESGYHLHKLSDGSYKCLPYCTKNTGIFLLVDRSRSTYDNKKYTKINTLLKGLKLSDRNYALYNEETENCGYNVAMSMLTFGNHTTSNYNLWNDVIKYPKCSDSSGTYFDKALGHIYNNYCKKDQPIIIMIITDGEIQKRKDIMISYMNSMINHCEASIIYVGPNSTTLKNYMNKNMTSFYPYDFTSNIQTWIDKTNDVLNDSCIPKSDSKKTPSKSDSSWFCNVLKNITSGKGYLNLTKEQCFSCPDGTVKFRWHQSQSNWGDVGVCCAANYNGGACANGTYEYN